MRDQYRWTDNGHCPARDETPIEVYFRSGGRARLQFAAQERLLPTLCTFWSLQTVAGQCTATVAEEKVGKRWHNPSISVPLVVCLTNNLVVVELLVVPVMMKALERSSRLTHYKISDKIIFQVLFSQNLKGSSASVLPARRNRSLPPPLEYPESDCQLVICSNSVWVAGPWPGGGEV